MEVVQGVVGGDVRGGEIELHGGEGEIKGCTEGGRRATITLATYLQERQ
jgi:hypothetical protein